MTNTLWEQNLRALQHRNPALAEILRARSPVCDLEVITARNGDPVPVWRGRPLYSRYDPRREAAAWAARAVVESPPAGQVVYLVFGLGLGYHLEALLKRDPFAQAVVFEPDPGWWRRLLELRDMRPIIKHKRVLIQQAVDTSVGSPLFRTLMRGAFTGTIKVLELPVYRHLFPEEYGRWANGVTEVARYIRVGLKTRERWKAQWLENSIANLIEVFANPGIVTLKNALKDTPAVMVAAGPSLDEHLEVLRELVGKVPIIAAGTGLVPLVRAGIRPDYVVSIDPGEGNYHALKDCLDLPAVTLVFCSSLHPRIVKEFAGPKLSAFADQEHLPRWIGEKLGSDKGVLPDASSVAIPTLQYASGLGCPEIVLLGQDLSFPDPDRYYAGRRASPAIGEYFPRPSVTGDTVYTTHSLLAMHRELEARVAGVTRAGVRVYNASRGLVIAGTRALDFARWAREQRHRRFKPPPPGRDTPSREQIAGRLREPLQILGRELAALEALAAAAERELTTLSRNNVFVTPALVRRLNAAVDKLNTARNNTAYQNAVKRTVQNLELLVTSRKPVLDAGTPDEIKSFICLLANFAASLRTSAEHFRTQLERILPPG